MRHVQVAALFAVILVMYASAAFHWAILLLNAMGYYELVKIYASQTNCQCMSGSLCPCIATDAPPTCSLFNYGLPGSVHGLALCAPTALLTINVCRYSNTFLILSLFVLIAANLGSPWRRHSLVARMDYLAGELDCSRIVCRLASRNIWYALSILPS